jgi:hypothetical protein
MTANAGLQLLVYRFGPEASFEGQLVGALERAEAGGALRVVEALFVGRHPETGEVVAFDERAGGEGFAAGALGFRLDERERGTATERAVGEDASGTASVLKEIAQTLEPGEAVAAVLLEHRWAAPLLDAVGRTGGRQLANEFVDAERFADVSAKLLAAARGAGSTAA